MNYIKLIKAYWAKHRLQPFSGNETLLYWRLIDLFNSAGEGDEWPDSMRFSDTQLCLESGLSPNTIDKFRKVLVNRELITFEAAGKGFRNGGTYGLMGPGTSSKRTSKSSSKNEELPKRTSEFEEVEEKVPQKVPQKEPQKDTQILRRSYIYISKLTNKLSFQTHKQTWACVLKKLDAFQSSKKRKKKRAPRIAPAPPKPVLQHAYSTDPFLIKRDSENLNVPFSEWYATYQLDIAEPRCRRLWIELTNDERLKARINTPPYVKSTPNKRFRKAPFNYLEEKVFNDEIIDRDANPTIGSPKNAFPVPANPFGQGQSIPAATTHRSQPFGQRNKPVNGAA